MNDISNYIVEKLKINKDSKYKDPKSIINYILSIPKKKIDNSVYNIVNDWVSKNKVNDIEIFYIDNEYTDSIKKSLKNIKLNIIDKKEYFKILAKNDYNFTSYEYSLEDTRIKNYQKIVLDYSTNLFCINLINGDLEFNILIVKF